MTPPEDTAASRRPADATPEEVQETAETAAAETAAETPPPVVRLVDESGAVLADPAPFGEAELFPGNVLTLGGDGAKAHYLVQAVDPGDPVVVHVVKARSNLHKTLLLLLLLGVGWFVVDWLVGLVAGS